MTTINHSSRNALWFGIAFAMVFPTVMAWIYFVSLAAEPSSGGENNVPPAGNAALQIAYSVGKAIQFGFPLFFLWVAGPLRLRATTLTSNHRTFPAWSQGLAFGLTVSLTILGFYHFYLKDTPLLSHTPSLVRAKVKDFGAANPIQYILLACFISGIHSFLEEYYWRWFVFRMLRNLLPFTSATVISSLGFMAHHVVILAVYLPGQFFYAVIPFSLGIAVGGAVWAWMYDQTGSLLTPWISHLIVDCAIMAVGFDMVFTHR